MGGKDDLFKKRLASLLLAQTGILPKTTLGLKSTINGFQSVGEILKSEKYWKKKIKDWKRK